MRWGVRKDRSSGSGRKSSSKSKGKGNIITRTVNSKVTNHKNKLIAKYKKKGMSDAEAQAAMEKRIKAEKYVAAAAGTALLAYAGYKVGRSLGKEYLDKTIKMGTELHTITTEPERTDISRFYGAYTKRDKFIYKNLYGKQLSYGGNKVYDVARHVSKDIKAPSRKNAAKAFAELYKSDSEFKTNVDKFYEEASKMALGIDKRSMALAKAGEALKRGGLTDKELKSFGYDIYNMQLANHDSFNKKFYDKLKDLGYNAVMDVNDRKYSGFRTNNPVIVFDMKSVVDSGIKQLDIDKIKDNEALEAFVRNGDKYITGTIKAGASLGAYGYVAKKSIQEEKKRREEARRKAEERREQKRLEKEKKKKEGENKDDNKRK